MNNDQIQCVHEDTGNGDGRVLETVDDGLDGFGVHGGIGGVTGGHCLEHGHGLLTTDLSHDHIFGSLPQSGPEKVIHIDVAFDLCFGPTTGNASDPVLVGEVDLSGIFNPDDL